MIAATPGSGPNILTVSELTQKIKSLLEDEYPFIWVSGEISNISRPASGHLYFTLKDDASQVRAVMFRGQSRRLRFRPADGLRVTGLGRLSVYAPRGTYQLIFEHLEPEGVGAIQQAFEDLKRRLAAEGLFDADRKRPLPLLPRGLALITSPSGAVVHDFLRIAARRFPRLPVRVLPTRVQGPGAETEIVAALAVAGARTDIDVAILARGGGSLEDLQPFNSEVLARAIRAAPIPVVSAVGHETDYTIADFAADLRAPTPSAAAELAVPEREALVQRIADARQRMALHLRGVLTRRRERIASHRLRIERPRRRMADWRLRVDELARRQLQASALRLRNERRRVQWQGERLAATSPSNRVRISKERLEVLNHKILKGMDILVYKYREGLHRQHARLVALNPRAILARGYSITRTLPDLEVVTAPQQVTAGRRVEILLSRGRLQARVLPEEEPTRSNEDGFSASAMPSTGAPRHGETEL